ncbi:DNA ligase D [Legionella oakridgensis]|uniref:DNA ligase (ATP) n=2 Tax=Legionella oakridgensis TaxID=29423 RepID=W0BDX7_9GAMM|nr:DNA ligase D [Legionella oakridgensis]AHE68075.1 DNA ligase D [Legionella oakridgensis ATCC 33761 = DSM 21215]ETO92421.1 DNA ligase D [Legionella oakridgensis RV-2-2007]KTD44532.1 putative ATP-dependent DNA ligase YkoU [Legionella oakridgensis]STY21057.1 Putative DNA ligase-like protein Rv0938/MT0965 [Legionella longbeachae]
MSLDKYHKKRDFSKTPEPKGKLHDSHHNLYIIQKHDARKLHYDFRIELDGVLKSWVIPKGPCLDPSVKRLAIHVEDHPLAYGHFEGMIPKGEYGAGIVLLWDEGHWIPLDDDPTTAYQKGHLRFLLQAKKLNGQWDLIRIQKQEDSWLLIKYEDEYAISLDHYDVIQALPDSVLSNQSIDEIREGSHATWSKQSETANLNQDEANKHYEPIHLDLPISPFPNKVSPQLATLTDKPPQGSQWLHEIKFDGYRILAFKNKHKVQLVSRNNKNWTESFQTIAEDIKKLPVDHILLDGEIVLLDKNGHSNFQLLQNAIHGSGNASFIYYIFDILYYEQWDLQTLPLETRKKLLEQILQFAPPALRYSDHILGQGTEAYRHACQFGLEGMLSKRRDGQYINQRSTTWLKTKCKKRQEFVVGGFSKTREGRKYFSALYLGVYDKNKQLHFCGKVGTGFNDASLQEIFGCLQKLISPKNPFTSRPDEAKKAIWVKPKLVVEIEFSEWTAQGKLRHPSFKGIRVDKQAKEVIKEKETSFATLEKSLPTKEIHLSNPQKILYPEDNISKKQLYDYYNKISTYILPYIKDRPLTLVRCPDSYQDCFFQKHLSPSTNKALHAFSLQHQQKQEDYLIVKDTQGLLALIQMDVLEIHTGGNTIHDIQRPDMITFDLDPAPNLAWTQVVHTAFDIKHHLEELDLRSFVKTSGGKGLHVVVPIQPQHEWHIIKQFAKLFVQFLANKSPDIYTTNLAKIKRTDKIFLDYLRNQQGSTAIAVYSTRAKLHAPIATPVGWDELSYDFRDTFFTIKTIMDRLTSLKEDPWKEFWQIKQTLKIND